MWSVLDEMTRLEIMRILLKHNGVKTLAARSLRVSRSTLYRRLYLYESYFDTEITAWENLRHA